MRLLTIATALFTLALPAAFAQVLLIHPFEDDGSLVGTVLADRVAASLEPHATLTLGPATAPAIAPPFPYQEGYVSPLALLEAGETAEPHGAALLRAATGVDLAASGRYVSSGGTQTLHLTIALEDGSTRSYRLEEPDGRAHLLAQRAATLIAEHVGMPRPNAVTPLDLAGIDDVRGRTLTLLAGGFPGEAAALLDQAAEADELPARLARWRTALRAVEAGRAAPDAPVVAALAALALSDDDVRTRAYFAAVAAAGLPLAEAWNGAIAADAGDTPAAEAAYERAAVTPYGLATRTAYLASQGEDADLRALAASDDPAVLVTAALLADLASETETLRTALHTLTDVTPTFAWPFERLSYLAFDEDDALAAAEALIVATALQPGSDLYWTNLGWAWYLLGFWDRSEAASIRATELDADAYIASYNLGLVRARFGRLDEAMPAYEQALARDPEVDDEALADVENAILAEPDQAALQYVLGRLYEMEGRRAEAAEAYQAYLALGGFGAPYDGAADRRIAVLTAPPPPLEIADARLEPLLGTALAPTPLHPGDPLHVEFEVLTPGEALPTRLDVTTTLRNASGDDLGVRTVTVDVPENAIGYVVQEARIDVPIDAAPGTYLLEVRVDGIEGTSVLAETSLDVAGEPEPLRQLVGRNVTLTSLTGSRPLFGADDVTTPTTVLNLMIAELRAAREAAEANLPVTETGRFAGLSGGVVFDQSDETDVRDFLAYLAADGVEDLRIAFVDAYAQWVVDGAPAVTD